jgi:adenylate kinase family enzyme
MKFDLDAVKTAYLEDDEFAKVQDDNNRTDFKSGLQIFSDHNGFRNGEVHTFIGTKGCGKSTWAKTLLSEIVWNDKSALLYISEESRDKYVLNLNRMFRLNSKTSLRAKEYLDNIITVSEMEISISEGEHFFGLMEKLIDDCELDIFIFDNFTTTFLSELHISEQSKILRRFKEIAIKKNIPVVIFFHTSKNVDPRKLDGDSVKGSGTAINIGSYNYVLYQHKDTSTIRNFIHTEKARYHNKANKKVYEVMYNYDLGTFTGCKQITMQDYREIVAEKKW